MGAEFRQVLILCRDKVSQKVGRVRIYLMENTVVKPVLFWVLHKFNTHIHCTDHPAGGKPKASEIFHIPHLH